MFCTRSQAVAGIPTLQCCPTVDHYAEPGRQSCLPNLKSLAQVVVEILRSKRIGVTSLTFQGHVTSSVT